VLDPNTGESKWKKRRVGVLGPKSRMTKHQAHDSLDLTIAQKTAGTTQPRAEKSIATLGWFTRNRYFALREGSTWNEGAAPRGQDNPDVGSTAPGTCLGAAQGSHPADIGHDRDVSAERAVRAPLEWLQHGQPDHYRQPDRLQGQAARLRQDQEVAADRAPAGGLANELWLWKQECPDASPDAFIFPNSRRRNGAKKNGFIRTDNYRARVLKKLAAELGSAS
jgi:hypothetical protein